jgi:tetratricopeptide (TPR) repeat protein
MAAALYRTLMAGRRALVVLDNARAADQVRPLLPGDPGCLVLVTSRDRLGGLVAHEGAAHRTLGVLTAVEARDLLARVLGRDRVEAEPDAAAALAAGCAYLPLALRIAAAQLALRPGRAIAGQAAELGTDGRLGALAVDGEDDERGAVRAAFDLSYQALPSPARRLFRALAAVPGPDFTAPVAAALLDTAPSEAAALLDRLAGAHLIDPQAGEERYSLHDLLRCYAAELAGAEDSAEVRAATSDRLYAHYLSTASAAADLLYPHMLRLPADPADPPPATAPFDDHAAALGWLDAERPNLVAAVRDQTGPAARAGCRLADLLRGYFHLRRHLPDWMAVGQAALAAAQESGDRHAECAARHSLGTAYRCLGDNTAALRHYAAGLRLARACGWAESEATALGNLGIMSLKTGRLKAAVRQLEKALALDRRTGSLAGQANNLRHLAVAEHQRGDLAAAATHFAESERLNRLTDCQHGQALALTGLGEVSHERGRFADAEQQLTAALDLYVLVGDRDGQSVAYHCLAALDGDAGRPERARAHALASITLAREIGDRRAEAAALNTLARAHHHTHRYADALDCHRRAHDLAGETGTRRVAIGALLGMSATHRHLGDLSEAAACALRALALARSGGYRTLENQARAALETSQSPFTDWIWSTSYA